MKKINLLLVFMLCVGMTASVNAQTAQRYSKAKTVTKLATPQKALTGMETFTVSAERQAELDAQLDELMQQYLNSPEDISKEIWLGTSSYDLQSNGVNKHRVHNNLGFTAGVWTYHEDAAATTTFPARGTGFTTINDDASAINGGFPGQRIEDRRTGWGNVVILDDGSCVVISHGPNPTTTTLNDLLVSRKAAGSDTWEHNPMPTGTEAAFGLLWPHIGTDGSTIHVACITTPVGNDGALYEGMDGALLYFRSTDGGVTWDQQDVLLPGVSAANFGADRTFNGDGYTLAVEGDHVAIVNFDDTFGDIDLWISSDAGDTWDRRKVLDFPIDNYTFNDGYTVDDIGGVDTNGPGGDGMGGIDTAATADALIAVLQPDGTGNAVFEEDGTLHVVYGNMYLSDLDTTDAGWTFYPLWSGISYWNTDMADDERSTIGVASDNVDVNGNDALDFDQSGEQFFPRYGGNSLTSAPSIVVTNDGVLFLAYVQKMETKVRPAVDGSANYPELQYFQNIYMTAAHKDILNWQDPYDLTNNEVMIVPQAEETEASFPHLYNNGSDNTIHTTWQWDPEPGMFVYNDADGDNDLVTNNLISYLAIDVYDLFPNVLVGVSTSVVADDVFNLELAPNPAKHTLNVQYELSTSAPSTITVSSIIGQQVMAINNGTQAAGKYNLDLNVSKLATGVYTLTFISEDKMTTKKLVVE